MTGTRNGFQRQRHTGQQRPAHSLLNEGFAILRSVCGSMTRKHLPNQKFCQAMCNLLCRMHSKSSPSNGSSKFQRPSSGCLPIPNIGQHGQRRVQSGSRCRLGDDNSIPMSQKASGRSPRSPSSREKRLVANEAPRGYLGRLIFTWLQSSARSAGEAEIPLPKSPIEII